MQARDLPDDIDGAGLFRGLDASARGAVASRLTSVSLARGDVLVRQGELADALYIVICGRFSVTRDEGRAHLTEIGPGQPIGEIGFLTGAPRTATVTALRDSLVVKLGRSEFAELAEQHPGIWPSLTATLATRLAATSDRFASLAPPAPAPRARTVALIRAGGSPIPQAFVARLTTAFERSGRTLVVDPDRARAELGIDNSATSDDEATRSLNDLERAHDLVLFIAGSEPSPWSEKAIRHADLVVAAADHTEDTTPNPLEHLAEGLLPAGARRLVLVHPTRGRVTGTRRWLTGRTLAMHHHVALDSDHDVNRLVRFIRGEARGLVACGGGAFCAAHIGVWRALAERGMEFDIVGGTSGGSAMAAAFLLNGDPDAMDAVVHDIFVTNKAMRRYTWPRYSLLDHAHFDSELKKHFGAGDIEDLWLPWFAVSTNLSRFTLNVHRTGPLWLAIRASSAIPVLLPPVYTADGEMLADGCLLDNVPVRTMHELKTGPNVVVAFEVPELERFAVDYGALPSRSELIRLALNPLRRGSLPDAPGMAAVLMRAMMANRHDFSRQLRVEDRLIVPDFPADMGPLDWHRHREMMERAYQFTLRQLDSSQGP